MNNSNNSWLGKPLRLAIRSLGHVPSFKNSKMLCRGRLITDPKKQKWMEQATASFVAQLRSAFQMDGEGMQTGRSLRSWIALSMPSDDCWQQIPVIQIRVELVPKGDEGADLLLERL